MAEYTGSSYIAPPVQAILDTKLTNPALDNLDLDMSNNNIIHCNNITFTLGGGGKIIFADDSSLNSAIGLGGGGGGGNFNTPSTQVLDMSGHNIINVPKLVASDDILQIATHYPQTYPGFSTIDLNSQLDTKPSSIQQGQMALQTTGYITKDNSYNYVNTFRLNTNGITINNKLYPDIQYNPNPGPGPVILPTKNVTMTYDMSGILTANTFKLISNLNENGGVKSGGIIFADDSSLNSAIGIGGGTPGAPLNSLQYNNNGAFAGSSNFSYLDTDSNGGTLTLNGALDLSGSITFMGTSIAIGATGIAGGAAWTPMTNQGVYAVALGFYAGQSNQQSFAVAIGANAGTTSQRAYAVAVGQKAGETNQSNNAVAIGVKAGRSNQGDSAIAIGWNAGCTGQGLDGIAIGCFTGSSNQSCNAIAIGSFTGCTGQGAYAIAIGAGAAAFNQSNNAIAIGLSAGCLNQGENSIAIGNVAGFTGQGTTAIAIGFEAGQSNQDKYAIALGYQAGYTGQGLGAIAIGGFSNISGIQSAGQSNQGTYAVAIGGSAGQTSQYAGAVAIGLQAGQTSQGSNSVAIGARAGYCNQASNSIILNATGEELNDLSANSFVVKPIRNEPTTTSYSSLFYNSNSGEIVFGLSGSGTGNFSTPSAQNLEMGGNDISNVRNIQLTGRLDVSGSLYVNPIRADATSLGVLAYNGTTKEITSIPQPSQDGQLLAYEVGTIQWSDITTLSTSGVPNKFGYSTSLTYDISKNNIYTGGFYSNNPLNISFSNDLSFNSYVAWTADDGQTWQDLSSNLYAGFDQDLSGNSSVSAVMYANEIIYAGGSYSSLENSKNNTPFVTWSADNGDTWQDASAIWHTGFDQDLSSTNSNYPYLSLLSIPNNVHALTYDSKLGRIYAGGGYNSIANQNNTMPFVAWSANGGETWQDASAIWHTGFDEDLSCNSVVYALTYDSNLGRIYAGGGYNSLEKLEFLPFVAWSANGGETWQDASAIWHTGFDQDLSGTSYVNALAYDATLGRIYAGGIYTSLANKNTSKQVPYVAWSSNGGQTWQDASAIWHNDPTSFVYTSQNGNIYLNGVSLTLGNNKIYTDTSFLNLKDKTYTFHNLLYYSEDGKTYNNYNSSFDGLNNTILQTCNLYDICSNKLYLGGNYSTSVYNLITGITYPYVFSSDLIEVDNKLNWVTIASNPPNEYITVTSFNLALGYQAGELQSDCAIAIGRGAGRTNQQTSAIAIGVGAGYNSQQTNAVAIGTYAGESNQQSFAVAIGSNAGQTNQKTSAIAIGLNAGFCNQGCNAIAIGKTAGQTNQAAYSTIISSTGSIVDNETGFGHIVLTAGSNSSVSLGSNAAGLYVKPIRGVTANGDNFTNTLYYNSTTGEVGSAPAPTVTPSGDLNSVQFNNNGAFGGSSNFTYSTTGSGTLQLNGNLQLDGGKVDFISNNIVLGSTSSTSAVYIGYQVGITSQAAYSTIINSTGTAITISSGLAHLVLCAGSNNTPTLGSNAPGLYMNPIRNNSGGTNITNALCYDSTTGEITHGNSGTKTFVIDHPLDPAKYLVHGCLEGPEAGVYYRGTASIPATADSVEIILPTYVDSLARDFTVHVTAISSQPPCFDVLVASSVCEGKFHVYRENIRPFPQCFDYLVMGKRVAIDIEPVKNSVELKGTGPYTWL